MKADYHSLRTSAGYRLGLARLPDSECAAVSIHVPAGGRHDPPGRSGLAHFVEHMIFKGTARRDARRISVETEDAGATLNAYTSDDQIVYEARGDASTLPLLADVLCDMVWQSTFPAHEVELERDVIREEIVMYHENPSEHIGDLISAALWSPHPLGQPISGTIETVGGITREDLAGFARRHHHDRQLVIAVAGPFTEQQVLDQFADRLPQPSAVDPGPAYVAPAGLRAPVIEARDTLQVQLALAFATFGRHDPRRHALRLLAMILGEGASSRLFLKLREERGLCYHISCDTELLADTGCLEIHAGLDPGGRDEALACIRAELTDLAERGPDEAELARAKRLTASSFRAAMEGTASHAGWAGECLAQHDRMILPAEALERTEAVTRHDVREVAREIFQPAHEAFAEIRPA